MLYKGAVVVLMIYIIILHSFLFTKHQETWEIKGNAWLVDSQKLLDAQLERAKEWHMVRIEEFLEEENKVLARARAIEWVVLTPALERDVEFSIQLQMLREKINPNY